MPQRFKLYPRNAIAAGVAAVVVMFSVHSSAQVTLEEVVVTAQKREQTVQDVPSSVAAISEELLNQTNTRDFSDLNKIASGITVTGGADGFGKIIRIRGVGTNAFAPAIRPAVGIFVNEVPLGAPESAYNNMADVERIEILKGPQATLFGKEVSSGAISIFSKRPEVEYAEGFVEGNFGNLDLMEVRAGGNLPLGDMFALRGSVYRNQRGGTVNNITLSDPDMGEFDGTGARLRLGFQPTDNFEAILSYERHDMEVYGSTSVAQDFGDLYRAYESIVVGVTQPTESRLVVLDPAERKTQHSNPTDRDSKTAMWYLNIGWDINDAWNLISVTSSQEYSLFTGGSEPSQRGLDRSVPDTADTSVGPYQLNDFYQDDGTDSFTQELRLNFDGDNWSSIFGFFYADTEIVSYVPFTNMLGIIGPEFIISAAGVSDLTDDVEEWALFNHNIWTIREGLDLTFGIRYSEVEKTAVKGQLTGVGPLGPLNSPFVPATPWADDIPTQQDKWDEITGTLKLTYWLNDEVSIYGGWDRGFKAGGHNVCKGTDVEPDCPEPFESELADNYEVGFKGRFFDSTLVWNGAIYYQIYSDYQVDIQDEEGIGNSVRNAAEVEIQGFETEFQWLASDNFLLDGNIAYVDARWKDYKDAGCLRPQYQAIACDPVTLTQDLSGERLNYTSPWSGNVNATYSNQFNNGLSWYLRGEVAYRDDRFFFPDLDPEVVDGDYWLFNASLGFTGVQGNWDVILWGKNLTDEDYLITASRNRDAGNPDFGVVPYESYRVTAGDQRTYGVTLKYRFGGG